MKKTLLLILFITLIPIITHSQELRCSYEQQEILQVPSCDYFSQNVSPDFTNEIPYVINVRFHLRYDVTTVLEDDLLKAIA